MLEQHEYRASVHVPLGPVGGNIDVLLCGGDKQHELGVGRHHVECGRHADPLIRKNEQLHVGEADDGH